jgi:hypothetical protein
MKMKRSIIVGVGVLGARPRPEWRVPGGAGGATGAAGAAGDGENGERGENWGTSGTRERTSFLRRPRGAGDPGCPPISSSVKTAT